MTIIPTPLSGCFIVENRLFGDDRGYFFESFNQKTFTDKTGIATLFVQDNQSFSRFGVLRGLHYQTGDSAQAKLVRVLQGKVLDVAVDIRQGSATYGQHVTVELSDDNKRQFYIPRGFAHGFVVLSETATFFYKCDNLYDKAAEGAIVYNDADLKIDWQIPESSALLSDKDRDAQTFAQYQQAPSF